MKFIDPSETAIVNKWGQGILRGLRSIPFLHVLISLLFTVIWIDLVLTLLDLFPLMAVILGLFLPIVLLIGVLQYKSKIAYGTVLAILVFSICMNIGELPYLIHAVGASSDLAFLISSSPIEDLQTNMELMIIALLGVSLMHNRKLVQRYEWNSKIAWRSIVLGALAYLAISFLEFYIFEYVLPQNYFY